MSDTKASELFKDFQGMLAHRTSERINLEEEFDEGNVSYMWKWMGATPIMLRLQFINPRTGKRCYSLKEFNEAITAAINKEKVICHVIIHGDVDWRAPTFHQYFEKDIKDLFLVHTIIFEGG